MDSGTPEAQKKSPVQRTINRIITVPGSLYDVLTRILRQVSRARLEPLRTSPVFFDQFYDDRYRVGLVAF